MKLILFTILTCFAVAKLSAQTSTSIFISGDNDKFYPVLFSDVNWFNNRATEISIGRSNVHLDSDWRGAIIGHFRYHTNNYGHRAEFIDGTVYSTTGITFIAGWDDGTLRNGAQQIVIWLRGGGTTYHIHSLSTVSVVVHDGVQNAVPYTEGGGLVRTYKTEVDNYVNNNGLSSAGTAQYRGASKNFFIGDVSIGTTDSKGYKLAVAGNMIAESVKVKLQGAWPDFVFTKTYKLPTLNETEVHIKDKGHLPGIPSASEVKTNGIDLGEMNAKLLQKIEELTLHLIEQNKELKAQHEKSLKQQEDIDNLKKLVFPLR